MTLELGPGAVVAGRYRLDRLLGRGGMGQVWAVTHEVTLRPAALKFLNAPLHLRADRRRRFFREARAASAVQHPNVVQIHDFFELEDGTPVMVMDLLEGETLGARLKREGSLPLADVVDLLLPVVSAVGTAHALGIVHRDLKPDNVFVAISGGTTRVCVLDFGIAKLTASSVEDSEGALTGTGAVLGTPRYMAPEQTLGDGSTDHRADIWSIGVMLYEALAGSRPIEGQNLCRILQRLLSEGITPLRVLEPDLPEDVLHLVDRMLTRDPDGRPPDLREVHAVLAAHATVAVPAFGVAVAERKLAPDSSPLSAPRSSPVSAPAPVVDTDADTLLDVSLTRLSERAAMDIEFSGAHELSVRRKARNRRWSFAFGIAALLAAGGMWRHFAKAPAEMATLEAPVAQAAVVSLSLAPAAPAEVAPPAETAVAVTEAGPAKNPAPSDRLRKSRTIAERPAPVDAPNPSAAPAAPPAAQETPRTGLVEEPPF